MKHLLVLLMILAAPAARADVDDVVTSHILPGYADFAAATATLEETASQTCDRTAIRPAWNAAFDAWLRISHIRFGPVEENGRSIIVAFWPDDRSATPRALTALIAGTDPIIETPEGVAQVSAAARGLFALEYLLYDPQFAEEDSYTCALLRALASDLAGIATQVDHAWRDGYATAMTTAGAEGNPVYLHPREARQALFTALLAGLEFTADQRLGRPMGTFDRPRPRRAESWRAARSQRNVVLSLQALSALATTLANGEIPQTTTAFARATAAAEALDDPALAGVADPTGRLRIEILQQNIHTIRDAILAEIGPELGVSAGFNAGDGD